MSDFQMKISDYRGQIIFETTFDDIDETFGGVHCPSGRVKNGTVFVNHAEEEDFHLLAQNHVDVRYKIFIARCGKIHLDNMVSKE